jgi:hypothetical protein
MEDKTKNIDKVQPVMEVWLVEKILDAVQHSERLAEANDLDLELLKTGKTHVFSPIDVSEYVGYWLDLRKHKRDSNKQGQEDSEINIRLSREEIYQDLEKAKKILGSDYNSTVRMDRVPLAKRLAYLKSGRVKD